MESLRSFKLFIIIDRRAPGVSGDPRRLACSRSLFDEGSDLKSHCTAEFIGIQMYIDWYSFHGIRYQSVCEYH